MQASLITPPYPYVARREGFNVVAGAPEEIDLPFTGLSASLDTIARRPDVVRRAIRAEIETLQHMHADRADTIRVMETRFAMDPELAAQAYDLAISAYTRDGSVSRECVDILLALEREEGEVPEGVRFEDVVDLRPLQDVQRAMGLAP